MNRRIAFGLCASALLLASTALAVSRSWDAARPFLHSEIGETANESSSEPAVVPENGLEVQLLVNGVPLQDYFARGRRYVEAFEGAEYEISLRNTLPVRVAVALSVDGLNSIDAKHTSAWNASKWVVGPYQTIRIGGWQMSSERARRFYFTTERDSYAAKLGQAANVGVISAVAFRERAPVFIPVTPPEPIYRDDRNREQSESPARSKAPASSAGDNSLGRSSTAQSFPAPDDESAATGIGRSVRNDVRWVEMNLEPRPATEVTIRYEYRAGLVRLGILPRPYPPPDVLGRRERAKGFEGSYCPEP
jgi:hypothetical protein